MSYTHVPIYDKICHAVEFIKNRSAIRPEIGIILGSGLASIVDGLTEAISISYSDIPYFHTPSVEGHVGKMLLGKLNDIPVIVLQGRFHLYEGHGIQDVVFPTRTLCSLGIHSLILTNASGGINTRFRAGDLMLIEDHLNLTGNNPLVGPNLSQFGARFPDLSEAYSKNNFNLIKEAALELGISLQTGVYAGLLGPTYETPAEVRMLRTLGADAVGMSTVSETIAAHHMGVKVSGISCITNLAAGLSLVHLSHEEVLETSRQSAEKMKRILLTVIPRIAKKTF